MFRSQRHTSQQKSTWALSPKLVWVGQHPREPIYSGFQSPPERAYLAADVVPSKEQEKETTTSSKTFTTQRPKRGSSSLLKRVLGAFLSLLFLLACELLISKFIFAFTSL